MRADVRLAIRTLIAKDADTLNEFELKYRRFADNASMGYGRCATISSDPPAGKDIPT